MRKLYYNFYILPIVDYGIIPWQYAPKRKLIKIPNIQKRSARMILDKSRDHPSNPLINELNWLPLQSRITYHVVLLVFKIHNDLAPNYLNTILLFTSNSRYELHSEFRCHLAQPKKKSYFPNLTLQSLITQIWNTIPEHMKSAKTVSTFKSML